MRFQNRTFNFTFVPDSHFYNPFTRSKTSQRSPLLRSLLSIGFTLNDKRLLEAKSSNPRFTSLWDSLSKGSVPRTFATHSTRRVLDQFQMIAGTCTSATEFSQAVCDYIAHENASFLKKGHGRDIISFSNELTEEDQEDHLRRTLSPDQAAVVELVKRGFNVYIGGPAGTGKTVVLSECIYQLRKQRLNVAVTATTGVSAVHIDGHTFHSVFGIQGERSTHIHHFDAVVIDEVSMLQESILQRFHEMAMRERMCKKPFGGIQMILCGDFLQLEGIPPEPLYASKVLRENFLQVKLSTLHRVTKEGTQYGAALSLLRHGKISPTLLNDVTKIPAGKSIPRNVENATYLFPRNRDVHEYNREQLERLSGPDVVYQSMSSSTELCGEWTETFLVDVQSKDIIARLQLRRALEDALAWEEHQIANKPGCGRRELDEGLNSVIRATSTKSSIVSIFDTDRLDPNCTLCGIRFRLDACLRGIAHGELLQSIRDKKTSLLKKVLADCGLAILGIYPKTSIPLYLSQKIYENAQNEIFYPPLTLKEGARVMLRWNLTRDEVNGSTGVIEGFEMATKERLLTGLDPKYEQWADPYLNSLRSQGFQFPLLPVVKFTHGKTLMIPPTGMLIGGDEETEFFGASLIALPLQLGYAFTVHKVQGLTLRGKVFVDLSHMWGCRHAVYVALSRVRDPKQLVLKGFHSKMVLVDSDAVLFDERLPSAEQISLEEDSFPETFRPRLFEGEGKKESNKTVKSQTASCKKSRKERQIATSPQGPGTRHQSAPRKATPNKVGLSFKSA